MGKVILNNYLTNIPQFIIHHECQTTPTYIDTKIVEIDGKLELKQFFKTVERLLYTIKKCNIKISIISYVNNLLFNFNKILHIKIIENENNYEVIIRGNLDEDGKRKVELRKRKLNNLGF